MGNHIKLAALMLTGTVLVTLGFVAGQGLRQTPTKDDLVNTAAARLALQDFRGAVDCFNAALILDPKDWALWNGRGMARSALNDFPGARADFETAIAINPSSGRLYNNRGAARFRLADYQNAVYDFTQAIALEPAKGEVRINRAQARARLGDREGALTDFRDGLALLPPGDWIRPAVAEFTNAARQGHYTANLQPMLITY